MGFDAAAVADYACDISFPWLLGTVDRLPSVRMNQRAIVCVVDHAAALASGGTATVSLMRQGRPVARYALANSTVDVAIAQAWTGLSPTQGPAAGLTLVTLAGYGFRVEAAGTPGPYVLAVEQAAAGWAAREAFNCSAAASSVALVCPVAQGPASRWIRGRANVSLLVRLPAGPLAAVSTPLAVAQLELLAQVLGLQPSSMDAAGGRPVTVSGVGFAASGAGAYRVVLSHAGWLAASENCSLTAAASPMLLICVQPAWPFPAGQVSLLVQYLSLLAPPSDLAWSSFVTLANFSMLIAEQVYGATALTWYADSAASVTVFGAGFDPAGSYACAFVGASGARVATAAVAPLSDTELVCPPTVWGLAAADATLVVTHGEAVLASPVITVAFAGRWVSIAPTSIAASSGGTVTVYGAGFSASDTYALDLRAPGQQGSQQLPATYESPLLLIVPVPPWTSPALNFTVTLLSGGAVFDAAAGNRYLWVEGALQSVSPSSGSALGGVHVFFAGAGFDTDLSRAVYRCRLLGGLGQQSALSSACQALNSSVVLCLSPPWPYLSSSDTIELLLNDAAFVGSGPFRLFPRILAPPVPSRCRPSSPVLVTLFGSAFPVASASLRCSFSRVPNATVVTPAAAYNESMVTCMSPVWTLESGPAWLTVVDPADPVATVQQPVKFYIDGEIFDIHPRGGPTTGRNVSITASGLNLSLLYACVVDGFKYSATAAPINRTSIECALPEWTSDSSNVSVGLKDVTDNVSFDGLLSFAYSPVITSSSPSSGLATGGAVFNVTGCCFFAAHAYRAVFFLEGTSYLNSAPVASVNMSLTSLKLLSTYTPDWKFSSQSSVVYVEQLAPGAAGWAPMNPANPLALTFVEVVLSSYPSSGFAFGSFLAVLGSGFITQNATYRCRFQSLANASRAVESRATAAKTVTRIEFAVPRYVAHGPRPLPRLGIRQPCFS